MKKYAVVFLAWGENYIQEVESCIKLSDSIKNYDLFLITDENTRLENDKLKVIRVSFETEGLLRKTELIEFLPGNYDSFLFLDSDTRVVEDISLGFEKADRFGIAVSPAPHYSLDHFWGFDKIMKMEGIDCKGQLQYNTGVIFFKKSAVVISVFKRWRELALKYRHIENFNQDQPFFTLALEQCEFNPYTLSISYNYRGFDDPISGVVRIWHNHGKMPENINEFEKSWPRRKATPGQVVFLSESDQIPKEWTAQ